MNEKVSKKDLEREIKLLSNSIEGIKKALLNGDNQKKLSDAENRLSEKRKELEEVYNNDIERNEVRKDKCRLRISQLESMAVVLRERIALLKEEYERLREISRDTADRIVKLETGTLCTDETGKELNNELKAVREGIGDIKREMRDMERELNTVEEDISQQREELSTLEKYKPLPVEADREYISLEKELAYRTARRDYLMESYSQKLKALDELNCRLYKISHSKEIESKNMA